MLSTEKDVTSAVVHYIVQFLDTAPATGNTAVTDAVSATANAT